MTAVQDRKAAEREAQVEQAHRQLTEKIDELMTPEGWEAMINARRWLRKYSLNNLMLILAQCPIATDVRPYGAKVNPDKGSWKAVGRFARPGQTALRIYAPSFRKDENGDDKLAYFRLVPVFDVSQTDGEPLAEVPDLTPELLRGDAPAKLWDLAAKLVADAGFSLSRAVHPEHTEANGVTDYAARTVTVRPDVEPAQAVKTLIHELAHIRCGHEKRELTRSRKEVEAESVACIVVSVANLDSAAYTVPYVAGWADGRTEIEESAGTVLKISKKILEDLGI